MFHIGSYRIDSRVVLAPMAGITDAPFRGICLKYGAGSTTSEMVTANTELWTSRKSSLRLNDGPTLNGSQQEQKKPRIIQIAGSKPEQLANAAKACSDAGADIVDINMGCPAKKVCSKAAGSALLRDEKLVQNIIASVIAAVDIPVTLKIRTGWCPQTRNGKRVARIAQEEGISALTVHGRTRACRFNGEAEYETIAQIVASVAIPVIANGDIDSAAKAEAVLNQTGAQAVMIGRAAQGRPWLFQTIDSYLKTPAPLRKVMRQIEPGLTEMSDVICEHLQAMYEHYGEYLGLRIARKHIKWYADELTRRFGLDKSNTHLQEINKTDSTHQQLACVQHFLEHSFSKRQLLEKQLFEQHFLEDDCSPKKILQH